MTAGILTVLLICQEMALVGAKQILVEQMNEGPRQRESSQSGAI